MSLYSSTLFNRKFLLAGSLLLLLLCVLPFALYLGEQRTEFRIKGTKSPYQIPALVLSYIPLKENGKINTDITGSIRTDDLETLRNKISNLTNQIVTSLEEASRYHGYKNPSAGGSLDYFIFDTKEFLYSVPRSDNQVPWNPGVYRPDYHGILSDLSICDYVDNKGIKEVWIWGYHYGDIEPAESNMAMGAVSKKHWNRGNYGDVSNSEGINDMPTCNKTYTLYNYNYGRGLGEALEDHTHQIEAVFKYIDHILFWNKFVESYGETDKINHCGWSHCPPNTKIDYDWRNEIDALSDCEDWKPDGTGKVQSANCHTWYGATCLDDSGARFKIWWMQNIPGKDNNLIYKGRQLRNWWDFLGDFDLALQMGKSLLFPVSSPLPPSPTRLQSPIPTSSLSPTLALTPTPTTEIKPPKKRIIPLTAITVAGGVVLTILLLGLLLFRYFHKGNQ